MRQITEITRPHRNLMTHYFLSSLFLGPFFFITLIPLFFKYQTLKYKFDDEGISMAWGILWRREINLTYARIQDIHVSRGLIERWLGLATIEVQTASGKATAEMAIVGVPEFDQLRDFLYSKMRGARFGESEIPPSIEAMMPGGTASAAGTPGLPAATFQSDEVAQLLTEIRDSLRRIRSGQNPNKGGTPGGLPPL